MRKLNKFMKDDRGAAQMIEAAILYPIVFLVIFFLIYMGLYILQSMSVATYAQKIAMLSAREIAHPFYIDEVGGNDEGTAEVTVKKGGSKQTVSGKSNFSAANAELIENKAVFETDPDKIKKTRAYRYWRSDPMNGYSGQYKVSLINIIGSASIINSKNRDNIKVEITGKNYFITQYITVKVEQEVIDFPALTFFGIKNPTVTASATSSVNDVDEFVRNSDFAIDTVSAISKKLGIDPKNIKTKISGLVGKKDESGKESKDSLELDELD